MQIFLATLLGQITMYRLMLYLLLVLFFTAIILSTTKIIPYDPLDIFISGIYLVIICNLSNYIFSKLFRAKTNFESATISALILTLIVGPSAFLQNLQILTFMGGTAMASKYLLAIRKKHIFNPVAIAVFLSSIFLKTGASWWIGSIFTLPIIILGGILVLAKIKKFETVASFIAIYFLIVIFLSQRITFNTFLVPSVWFFAFVMLVEPLTSPTTRKGQILFGGFVALSLFLLPKIIFFPAYGIETALLAGNLLNLFISRSYNVVLVFRKKEKIARNTWSFYFDSLSNITFTPGQYLEWTFPHKNPDSRGTRRYFTISSAPGEKHISLAIKAYDKRSSFKSAFLDLKNGDQITASSPQGDFILPKDKNIPLAFVAGGIGITPFRSMIKNLLANNEKRNIILLYSNNTEDEITFKETFEKAKGVGVKSIFITTEKDGYIDEKMIEEKIPDYKKRVFYISGPELLVEGLKDMLSRMKPKEIKTDFFPGYTEAHKK